MNELSLIINNREYSGWMNVSFKRSMESLCNQFSVSITDRFTPGGRQFFVAEGDGVIVKIDGKKILTGYVDFVNPSHGTGGTRIEIEGRDVTADLVDCSAVHKTGSFKKTTLENMVKILLQPFNLSAIFPADLPKEKFDFSIDSGDTAFQAIDRLASKYGLLLQTDTDGRLIFMKNIFQRADTGLSMGDNVKNADAQYNMTDRFSEYIVRGQNSTGGRGGWKKSQPQITGRALDGGITRNRPLLLQAETNANAASCRARAEWEATIRRARAVTATLEVQGWYQTDSDRLWAINEISNVNAPQVYIDNLDLLISAVNFRKNNSEGTITTLDLVPEDSYLREPPKEKKRKKGRTKKRWL